MSPEEPINGNGRWITHFEEQLAGQSRQISELASAVAAISADVRSLTHKPVQWQAILAAVGMGAAFVALVVAPIQRDLTSLHSSTDRFIQTHLRDAREMGEMHSDIAWLMRMDERNSQHHTDEWNRAKDAMGADLQGDLANMHECAEKSKELIMELIQNKADRE